MISINRPMYLVAEGSDSEVRVHRSPIVRDHDPLFAPVLEYIQRYGLVLMETKTTDDPDWYFGKVVSEVYVKPEP